ncbi:peptidylprolyl isomerase [Aquimarina agarivorans]|uniref:peptidylprolyl isomerase n=1 Tax=Aquimarina agarivorans TaxID=980584 RepID=UPI000248F5BB|nr:peptidylprolyl isomerase [Aquimarina agarivorans]
MKKLNYLFIALIAAVFTSCNEKYPDLEDGLYAEFNTNKGTAVADLHFEDTPMTVANFVALAEGKQDAVDSTYAGKRFYDGLIFHRIIKDFMIQGGDPLGTGVGNPGYKFPDEIVDSLSHDKKGILSMANSGPGTNGSQFFITLKETPWLNGRHTVFGEIVEGQAVIDSIGNTETKPGDKPKDTIVLNSVNIIRKGSLAKAFDAPSVYKAELEKIEAEKLKKEQEEIALAKGNKDKNDALKPQAKITESGLGIVSVNEGTGKKIKQEEKVGIYYVGYLEDGRIFDTNIESVARANNKFDQVRLDRGLYKPMPVPYSNKAQMIPGFKEGLLSMDRIGDKSTIFIPSALGYGERGAGGVIPPNANLVFDIEFAELEAEKPKDNHDHSDPNHKH